MYQTVLQACRSTPLADWIVTRGTSQSGEGTVHLKAYRAASYEAYNPIHKSQWRNSILQLKWTDIDHDRKVRGVA